MRKFIPSLLLTTLALIISYIIGYLIQNSWYLMSSWLFFIAFIYVFLGYISRRMKIKQYRQETDNPYGKLEIEDKFEFFYSVYVLLIASVLTFFVYLVLYYGFNIG